MPTLAIYAREDISVLDYFGEYFLRVKRWAINLMAKDEEVADEDEPHETDDSPDSGTDPPTLGISVNERINTNDTFGKH
jgi:hypothetical protein